MACTKKFLAANVIALTLGNTQHLTPQEETVFVGVLSLPVTRECLQLKCERHRVIETAIAVITHPKSQRSGPVSEVPVDRVVLLLHRSVPCFKMVRQARCPILVQLEE